MSRRIRSLEGVDARAVPLPHGTEVVTRVTRSSGEVRAPEGTVGRVMRVHDDGSLDVQIVGVGTLRYARDELVPRRVGQVLFAVRRDDAWGALSPCMVIDAVVGSRAWGLAEASSDEDRRGVFALPFVWSAGLAAAPEDLVRGDGSATYWSVGKTVRQALRSDPNTLEMLFVETARATDPIGEWILAERDAFASREIYGTFARYALAQLRRLEQGMRLADHRHRVLAWLREDPAPTLDVLAARLAAISPRVAPTEDDARAAAREWVKQLYRSMRDQGLVEAASLEALTRFAREDERALELPRELRPKNAYNLVRLLHTAEGWLRTGAPRFAVEEPVRSRLAAIKRGEVALDEVLRDAERLGPLLEEARDRSPLPARPDVVRADALLRRVAEELARRHLEGVPGPLGRDATVPSAARWDAEDE